MGNITSYIPVIMSGVAFLIVILVGFSIWQFSREREKKRALINRIQHTGTPFDLEMAGQTSPITDQPQRPMSRWLGSLGKRFTSKKPTDYSRLRMRFLRAGYRHRSTPAVFWGVKIVITLIIPGLFLIIHLTLLSDLKASATLFMLIIVALLAFYLPDLWLHIRTARRKRKITEAFPDALDLLVVCVEAGMGLDLAINRVAKELDFSAKELSEELRMVNLEINAGSPRREALRGFASRTNLDDISSFVTLIIQAEKFGTSVAQTLRVYSDTFRKKRFMRAEEKAAKLTVKLVVPLILFIFPALFIVILGPGLIQMSRMLFK